MLTKELCTCKWIARVRRQKLWGPEWCRRSLLGNNLTEKPSKLHEVLKGLIKNPIALKHPTLLGGNGKSAACLIAFPYFGKTPV